MDLSNHQYLNGDGIDENYNRKTSQFRPLQKFEYQNSQSLPELFGSGNRDMNSNARYMRQQYGHNENVQYVNGVNKVYPMNPIIPPKLGGGPYMVRPYERIEGTQLVKPHIFQTGESYQGNQEYIFQPSTSSSYSSATLVNEDTNMPNNHVILENHPIGLEYKLPSNYINHSSEDSKFDTPKNSKKKISRKRLTDVQKLAHNKIEKKYRININSKIAQLQKMIPWVSDGETAFEVNSSLKTEQSDGDSTSNSSKTKFNKSIILQKAIDYIVYLRNNEHLYQTEIDRLRQEVETLRNNQKS
ncbi:Helix-loop-helix DNA-binding domain [Nakaseomyces glabratus]